MKKTFLPLIPLLLAVLACQAISTTRQPIASLPTAPVTHTAIPLSITPTSTSTLLPPTSTPTPLPPTATTTSSSFQRAVFEDLWKTVDENYLYADFNGLDWDQVYQEYSQRIASGLSDEDFYAAMKEMIARLGDDHSAFFTPAEAKEEDAQYAGDYRFVGIGVMVMPVPERQRVTIIAVFPGSPAEQAGLQIHDNILAVDGKPVIDETGFRRDRILGPEGTTITITVQTPGQTPRQLNVMRQSVGGSLPVFYKVLPSPAGKRIGYILLTTFSDKSVDEQVRQALETMSAEAPLDGLVLDNRNNGGGYSDVVSTLFSYFTDGTLGHFVNREKKTVLSVQGVDIAGSQTLPLVILVGQGTASFAEIFSGVLQILGRAYLIGEQTDGNVEILYIYNFTDGSRAWIAHDTFRPLNHPEVDWEKTGLTPDQVVLSNWDEVTLETDPAVLAALEYFDR
jgi:carboxyl-terminal processing protease